MQKSIYRYGLVSETNVFQKLVNDNLVAKEL